MRFDYGVIVIGGGHAGCEAAYAVARLGVPVLLITLDMNKIAQMSCNPAIGGIAKGQIVREIDAMGGLTGIVTDRATIQFRMLNRSKGPAMWSPRAQCDRMKYSQYWREYLENTPGLSIWQDEATDVILDSRGAVAGVRTALGAEFHAPAVVVTAGTFLNGLMHVGRVKWPGGRISEPAACCLSQCLATLGLKTGRMKTGTPVRIDGRSVNWELTETQWGDDPEGRFSYLTDIPRPLRRRPCHIVHTNPETHEVLRSGLADSPLYNGQIQSIGPRYCPSIETKIVTFADKLSHQLFIEPEGEITTEFYLNGFSSSLPLDIQLRALRTIPAFKDVTIFRPGYAIEYDYFDPTGLHPTLESKYVKGLFMAGQVNGTTGYEEAAGQGLVAGVNAAAVTTRQEPFVLTRDQAYIGVLIDDLVTKGVDEPYRMFTSRAEHRILLRQDNADMRLTPLAAGRGMVTAQRLHTLDRKKEYIAALTAFVSDYKVKPEDINPFLAVHDTSAIEQGVKLKTLISRPQLNIPLVEEAVAPLAQKIAEIPDAYRQETVEAVEIEIKYSGYIEREKETAAKLRRLDKVRIPDDLDYASITSITTEARQKLSAIRPVTIGQASRIPGVSPNDINVLLLILGR